MCHHLWYYLVFSKITKRLHGQNCFVHSVHKNCNVEYAADTYLWKGRVRHLLLIYEICIFTCITMIFFLTININVCELPFSFLLLCRPSPWCSIIGSTFLFALYDSMHTLGINLPWFFFRMSIFPPQSY